MRIGRRAISSRQTFVAIRWSHVRIELPPLEAGHRLPRAQERLLRGILRVVE
jgi:hypothetical protein